MSERRLAGGGGGGGGRGRGASQSSLSHISWTDSGGLADWLLLRPRVYMRWS